MIMEHVNRYLSFYVSWYELIGQGLSNFFFFHTDSDSRIRKKISSHCIVHTVQSRKWSEKCGIIADDKRPTPEVSNYSNCLWTRVCGIFSDNCQFPHSYICFPSRQASFVICRNNNNNNIASRYTYTYIY